MGQILSYGLAIFVCYFVGIILGFFRKEFFMAISGANINDIEPNAWYNQADAARLLRADRRSMRRWELRGILTRVQHKRTGMLLYEGSALRRFLAAKG